MQVETHRYLCHSHQFSSFQPLQLNLLLTPYEGFSCRFLLLRCLTVAMTPDLTQIPVEKKARM